MPACPTDEGLGDKVSDRKGIGIAVVGEGIEFVVLLPMLDPDLLLAHGADQDQILVEVDVVCLQPSCKVCVATEVVIVIADHHSDLDTSPGGSELIENGLVRRNGSFRHPARASAPRTRTYPRQSAIQRQHLRSPVLSEIQ